MQCGAKSGVFTYQSDSYHFDRLFTLYISVTPTLMRLSRVFLCGNFFFVSASSFRKRRKRFRAIFHRPFFRSDKDVTLICFMDIKFQLARKLATTFV